MIAVAARALLKECFDVSESIFIVRVDEFPSDIVGNEFYRVHSNKRNLQYSKEQ